MHLTIDRKLRYSQSKPIHQTKVMMELVTKSGLDLNENTHIKNIFKFNKMFINTGKLCLLHLSSKWVNKYFSEDNFIRLLENLKKLNINIVMTSDSTSKDVFYKIFEKYDIVTNLI